MELIGDLEQFDVLEEKIDALLDLVGRLREENKSLSEKVQIQEEKIADLSQQVEVLKSGRDRAKQKVVQLLEKLENVEVA